MDIENIKKLYSIYDTIVSKSGHKSDAFKTYSDGTKTVCIKEVTDNSINTYCINFNSGIYTINGSDVEYSIGDYAKTFNGTDYKLCDLYHIIGSGVINLKSGNISKAMSDLKKTLGIYGDNIGVLSMNEEVFITSLKTLNEAINDNLSREYYYMDLYYLGRDENVHDAFFVTYGSDYYCYNDDQIRLIKLYMSNYLKFICSKLSSNGEYVIDYFGFDHIYKKIKK